MRETLLLSLSRFANIRDMELNSYLKRNHGKASKLAAALGLSPVLISQWAVGGRPVPIARCPAIERATHGLVTRQDLRPQDWHLIWPELAAMNDGPASFPVPAALLSFPVHSVSEGCVPVGASAQAGGVG